MDVGEKVVILQALHDVRQTIENYWLLQRECCSICGALALSPTIYVKHLTLTFLEDLFCKYSGVYWWPVLATEENVRVRLIALDFAILYLKNEE